MAIPNKVVDLWRKFNAKFPLPVGESAIREHCFNFAKQCNHSFPGEGYCTKSASPTRPMSKDTITKVTPPSARGYDHTSALCWDLVLGAGTGNPRPVYGGNSEHDIHNPPEGPQWAIDAPATDFLNEEPGPGPNPPNADRQKLIEVRNDIDEYLKDTSI